MARLNNILHFKFPGTNAVNNSYQMANGNLSYPCFN